jgi:hypothetical protein
MPASRRETSQSILRITAWRRFHTLRQIETARADKAENGTQFPAASALDFSDFLPQERKYQFR